MHFKCTSASNGLGHENPLCVRWAPRWMSRLCGIYCFISPVLTVYRRVGRVWPANRQAMVPARFACMPATEKSIDPRPSPLCAHSRPWRLLTQRGNISVAVPPQTSAVLCRIIIELMDPRSQPVLHRIALSFSVAVGCNGM